MIRRILQALSAALLTALLVTGCTTAPKDAAIAAVEKARAVHDTQLAAGETLSCGAPLRSMIERYGKSPGQLYALLTYCGFAEYFNHFREDKP